MQFIDHPVELIALLFAISVAPLFAVIGTSFLKFAIVLNMLRTALGTQQAPPSMAIYGIALAMTMFVMAPVGYQISTNLRDHPIDLSASDALTQVNDTLLEPYRAFLKKQTAPEQIVFFKSIGKRVWPETFQPVIPDDSLVVLIPAFAVSELVRAFKISILLFLPFLAIDIIVTNVLLSMGMMMVSPVTISLPFKILLFVVVNGWSKLLFELAMTYR
jgi:type III secretion protein R